MSNNGAKSAASKLKLPPSIKNGWFTETDTFWPGQRFSLALEEFSAEKSILFHQHSDYQEVLVFKSAQYGTTLVLGKSRKEKRSDHDDSLPIPYSPSTIIETRKTE